jgi:hypothetical protein
VIALTNLCVAVPLAVFGALHLFGPRFVMNIVPAYMPWRMFWVYAVGAGLIAASVSIAANIAVRWSGLLFGIMMFLFVAMIHLPGALASRHDRIIWTIVFRETSFGGAGWILAGLAMAAGAKQRRNTLVTVGRVCVTAALIVFGVEHFCTCGTSSVPLVSQSRVGPGRATVIDIRPASAARSEKRPLAKKPPCAGGWILLLVLVIYGPVLAGALSDPGAGVQLEGINYFADTLLFSGAILALASGSRA